MASKTTELRVPLYCVSETATALASRMLPNVEGCRSVEERDGLIAFVFDAQAVDQDTAGVRVWEALDRYDFNGEHLEPLSRVS